MHLENENHRKRRPQKRENMRTNQSFKTRENTLPFMYLRNHLLPNKLLIIGLMGR